MKMEAKSIGRKTFQLTDKGQQLGELVYENLFFLRAEIRLTNSDRYDIKPAGIFGTSVRVTKEEVSIANMKMNWRGQIVLAFQGGEEFVLKAKGMFHDKYIIEGNNKEKLIQFDPKFNWNKFSYNYDIAYDKKPEDILFVLLGVYASNYLIASMSGASAGIA